MTNVSRSLVLEVGINCDQIFFLKSIHYACMLISRVMLYASHEYDIYMVVRSERFQEVGHFAWI